MQDYKEFFNTIKRNENGESCFALAAHRVAILIKDVQEYLKNADLVADSHQYACCFKTFVTDEKAGISGVLDVLHGKHALAEALEDGGEFF